MNPYTTRFRLIGLWLLVCCLMILAMTVIGAITRLTESGLSITEWNVVMGTLPPLNDAHWQAEFDKYKATPEFEVKHYWMTVEDFKKIYFWEWFHRLWGRLIGLVYAIPLIIFWRKGWIPQAEKPKFLGFLALGALQGFMGWFMVQSGLQDRPSVSHYRLAAHLSLALIIYSLLLWTALQYFDRARGFVKKSDKNIPAFLKPFGVISMVFLSITIVWGAFVAGLDAGLIYNEFPRMGANFMPPEMWAQSPQWINLFENHASVQFVHRWIAMFTGLVLVLYAAAGVKFYPARFAPLGLWVFVQIGLGIKTLIAFDQTSPLHDNSIIYAAIHQFGAVILLTLLLKAHYWVVNNRRYKAS
jgi:heme a synthase